jgi:flagellar basal-body rod protein FlgC
MDDLVSAMSSAASGLRAQTVRMRLSAENLANADSTATTPGGDPYRRRTPVFAAVLDRETGAMGVELRRAKEDTSAFPLRFDPTHPAADAAGWVKEPNVSSLIEVADMREAQRAYEANLNVIENARSMASRTLDLLRR